MDLVPDLKQSIKEPQRNQLQNNSMIEKLDSFDAWITSLKDKNRFTEDECQKIKDHTTLGPYIRQLIVWVNDEPAILNDNYKESSTLKSQSPINNTALSNSRFYQFGLRVTNNSNLTKIIDQSAIDEIIELVNRKIQLGKGIQSGGGYNIEDLYNNSNNETKKTYSLLTSLFISLKQKLESLGKKIDPTQEKKIEGFIKNLQTSENMLIKTNYFIKEYIKLLGTVEEDNDKNLTMSHIKDFVEAHNSKIKRTDSKRDKILTVLKTLKDLV
jgi:hypothetical protein